MAVFSAAPHLEGDRAPLARHGFPGTPWVHLSGLNQCAAGGCLIELAQELLVIMVGKQVINNMQEVLIPKLKGWWQKFRLRSKRKAGSSAGAGQEPWEADYELVPCEGLFDEYLEMGGPGAARRRTREASRQGRHHVDRPVLRGGRVPRAGGGQWREPGRAPRPAVLQFGFVTIFVAACPLAPLFALLNNWVEIRLDARKFVCEYRRPVAERAQDIGIWFPVLTAITHLAVTSNAFLLAFSSDFLPRAYYRWTRAHDLRGFVNFTLARAPAPFAAAHNRTCRRGAACSRETPLWG
ncbi:Anoctamin-7 [Saguinus oedipus]|uniref:Anoctamin n=1 Tax=Saguinus oedipus TaxID=9490 RepID=A0ABQ9VFC0_SAGOE|nr:Anoctamin-7 [Saguinus oedipus]